MLSLRCDLWFVLVDQCPPRRAGTSFGMEKYDPLPLNYYNFEIMGFSGKDMVRGIRVLY